MNQKTKRKTQLKKERKIWFRGAGVTTCLQILQALLLCPLRLVLPVFL
jgi:hypothetical protein